MSLAPELVGFPVLSHLHVVKAFWMGLFSMAFDKIKRDFCRKGERAGGLPRRFPLGVIIDT